MAAFVERVSSAVPLPVRATRGQPCLPCHQRKAKCDNKRPCSRCVKSGAECRPERRCRSPRPLVKGSSAASANLLDRLRHYEKLLAAHGVQLDGRLGEEETDRVTETETETETETGSPATDSEDGVEGELEAAQRANVQLQLADGDATAETVGDEALLLRDRIPPPADNLVFGRPTFVRLGTLHPTVPQVMLLWHTFIHTFNPLVKLFHAPTVQNMISSATADLESVDPATEALMFAIYLCAATTMSEDQCLCLLSTPKTTLLARYSNLTQQALVNAKFLKSTDLVVVQALTLYLLASRHNLDSQSLWLISGLAHRLGETMGMHKEALLQNMAPFEAEIRRRLWWQIVMIEGRSAVLTGVATDGAYGSSWDTKRPINLNDSDLSPMMREYPAEHEGVTEMLFCIVRFEIGDAMRKLKGPSAREDEKELVINDLERRLEPLFGKCDPSIPIHLLSMLIGRSAIAKMRLLACNPPRNTGSGGPGPPPPAPAPAPPPRSLDERNKQFELALQVLAYDSMVHATRAIQPFLWHVVLQFPFEAFILVLTELLLRTRGDDADRGWVRVNQAYEDHPALVTETRSQLYVTIGNLAVRAWERRMGAVASERSDMYPVESHAIGRLREQREQREKKNKGPRSDESMGEGVFEPSADMEGMDPDPNPDPDPEKLGWGDWQALLRDAENEGFRL